MTLPQPWLAIPSTIPANPSLPLGFSEYATKQPIVNRQDVLQAVKVGAGGLLMVRYCVGMKWTQQSPDSLAGLITCGADQGLL